jgi:uncharacterized repeat protein (TIGR01451 family)
VFGDAASVEVVEPELALDKTNTPTTVLPGDSIAYTIRVAHTANSSADAFDLVIGDLLPAGLVLTPGSVTTSAGTIVATDGGVRVEVASYPLGSAPIEIHYSATIADGVAFGTTLENTAQVDWDDVGGPGGRPGSDEDVATVSNLGYAYDSFHQFGGTPDWTHDYEYGPPAERWDRLPRLTLDPLYSGTAEPAATVSVLLHGQHGAIAGFASTLADAGGNWVVSFPSATIRTPRDWVGGTLARITPARIFDQPTGVIEQWRPLFGFVPHPETVIGTSLEEAPHDLLLEEQRAIHTAFDDAAFSRRAYFTGALDASVFVHGTPSVETTFDRRASNAVETDLRGATEPFSMAWNKFNLDYLASSSSPGGR